MNNEFMKYAYFKNEIIEFEKATVSIATHSLQYGTTCFGGIRGYYRNGKVYIFRLKDHYIRLMNASKMLGFEYFISWEKFRKIISELVEKNDIKEDFYMRPFVFCSQPRISPKKKGLDFELAIYLLPLADYVNIDNGGIKFMSSTYRKYSDAAIPTKAKAGGSYINSFLATSDAQRNGYDEALMFDNAGNVVEASVANIILIYRDKVIVPDTGFDALEGITVRSMIELLEYNGYKIHKGKIDRSMVFNADELLVTGTAMKVVYAESLDGRPIGTPDFSATVNPGKYFKLLKSEFEKVIAGEHELSKKWLDEF
ncbi:branched-chain amino acid aminotransferase [Leptotrichia sp. OH3620_COT-345]|uniref:aminotransferase class IV n=1 Tax=Leptotrichia sp. OH3620_COT-345 TaxID=2491048 RepID=UPI000F64AE46|nr:aminotransferase class IV [Leptotrichia sp. OH3620_COT-345]RRD39598.1 branched-chain amino acid aminotransferase [Leptotrichia sp. OH3620_COT-345]